METNVSVFMPTEKELNILNNFWEEDIGDALSAIVNRIGSKEELVRFLIAALILKWKNLASLITGHIITNKLYSKEELQNIILSVKNNIPSKLINDTIAIRASKTSIQHQSILIIINKTVKGIKDAYKNINGLAITEDDFKDAISIDASAFEECTGLTNITIPSSVTSIGEYAFRGCSELTSIIIPSSVTSIGNEAFARSGLTSITIPDSVTSIGGDAFSWCIGLTSIEIPDSVTSIGVRTFFSCKKLKSINIPDAVTCINDRTFCYCEKLTSINIPDAVTSIKEYAFNGCVKLMNVIIPSNVTDIGDYAFSSCYEFTSIEIPDSVTNIGYRAFYNCPKLASITIGCGVTSIGDYAFYKVYPELELINYNGTKDDWKMVKTGDGWVGHTTITIRCTDGDLICDYSQKNSI